MPRTNLCFAHALPMALSCFLAYGSSGLPSDLPSALDSLDQGMLRYS